VLDDLRPGVRLEQLVREVRRRDERNGENEDQDQVELDEQRHVGPLCD
jgi:hypothetical protein